MAVAQGYGKTITSGSVFAYDTGDTRNSYIGEPTTNIYSTDGYSFWQLNGNHTATRYTGNAPDLTTILNNYDYHTIVTTGNWSNEVDRALLWTNSGLLQLNTQYAVSFYARVISTSTANIGAAFYGNALPNSLTLTNQWQRFTVLTSTTATFRPFEFGSKSGAIAFQVAGIQYEAKSHSTPYVNGTRSATQGLLPLVGNSTLDLSNVSFDSNAQMTFDGTDDYVNVGDTTVTDFSTGDFTVECIVKIDSSIPVNNGYYKGIVVKKGAAGANAGFGIYFNTGYGKFLWSTANGSSGSEIFTTNTWNSLKGSYAHVVMVRQNGATNNGHFYINGIYESIASSATVLNVNNDYNLTIGASSTLYSAYYFQGQVPTVKIYNRALSAGEVRQNYLHYKTRFNLS